mmetsp:Transcript_142411/g.455123  ORF Transcript_142411/g.455123 Transcript_142411/m.455123 type:complete len:277 (-) Transcript_142411:184-1014(-)
MGLEQLLPRARARQPARRQRLPDGCATGGAGGAGAWPRAWGAAKASPVALPALLGESDEGESETTAASTPTLKDGSTCLWPATPASPSAPIRLSLDELMGGEEFLAAVSLPAAPASLPALAAAGSGWGQEPWAQSQEQQQWCQSQEHWMAVEAHLNWGYMPGSAVPAPAPAAAPPAATSAPPPVPLGSPKLPAHLKQSLLEASAGASWAPPERDAFAPLAFFALPLEGGFSAPKWAPPPRSPAAVGQCGAAALGAFGAQAVEQALVGPPAFAATSC